MANFNDVIDTIIGNEGGYVNDSNDLGGETKYGISKRAYPNVDIKNLTLLEAKTIYKRDYWDKVKGDYISNTEVASSIFDYAVNVGVASASRAAQSVSGALVDGIIGGKTLEKINAMDDELFIAKYKLTKIERYVSLVENRKKNYVYLLGWIKRALR